MLQNNQQQHYTMELQTVQEQLEIERQAKNNLMKDMSTTNNQNIALAKQN